MCLLIWNVKINYTSLFIFAQNIRIFALEIVVCIKLIFLPFNRYLFYVVINYDVEYNAPIFYFEDSNDAFLKNIRFLICRLCYICIHFQNLKAFLLGSNNFMKFTRFSYATLLTILLQSEET